MTLQYFAKMPAEHGEYLFQLKDRKVYGYFSSFRYPYDQHIKIVNFEEERFYYIDQKEVCGYYHF